MQNQKPTLSKKQVKALALIDEIEKALNKHDKIVIKRWFIQPELQGITLHSMKALVEKGYLETIVLAGIVYYRAV